MVISRDINGIEIDIDTSCGGDILLPLEDVEKMRVEGKNPSEITDIMNYIYDKKTAYLPLMGILELCSNCNFKCPFCFINTKEERKRFSKKLLYFSEIKNDIDWLIDRGLLYCIITGGEALLHPEFVDIYKYLKNKGVIITVFSNLSNLTNDLVEVFKENPPLKIEATIYGFEDEIYYKTTGQNSFSAQKFRENVLTLKNNGITVICKTPINTLNFQDFEKIRFWCNESNVPYYFSEQIFETYDGENMEKYKTNQEIQKYILHERVGSIEMSDIQKIKKCFSCGAGKYGFFISHNYMLRPCMSFFDIEEANFLIKKDNISEAFSQMEKFINQYKDLKLSDCLGCEAYDICKVCAIDEIKKINGQSGGYTEKCKKNMDILNFLRK